MNQPVHTINYKDLPPITLPREIEIDFDKEDTEGDPNRTKWLILNSIVKAWKQDAAVLRLFRKYCANDGWSAGFTVRFWNMTASELKQIQEWFYDENIENKNNPEPKA